jgi:hypothetical protein
LPSTLPFRPKTSPQLLFRRFRLWIIFFFLAIAAIIAGVVVHRLKKGTSVDRDPSNPSIAAFAATECDAGVFVFSQDNLAGDIYLQGALRNGTWNQTNSRVIPKTKIEIPVYKVQNGYTPPEEYVSVGTNLTAVCWSEPATIVCILSSTILYFLVRSCPEME